MKASGKTDHARLLHEAGDHEGAERHYRTALARKPGDAEMLRLLGLVLHQTGRGAEALEFITRAHHIRPNDWTVLDLLGVVLKAQGRLDEAITVLNRAVSLEPAAFGPRFNLGNALHAAGRTDDAVTCYRRAIRAEPAQAGAWNNLGDAHMARQVSLDAVPCYRAAVRLQPRVAEYQFNLAQALHQAGDKTAAAAHHAIAAGLAPGNVVMAHHLGHARKRLADHDGAAEAFANALRLQPGDPGMMNDLGSILQMIGQFDEAERLLREVVRLLPDDPLVLTNLGQLLADLGQLDEAEAWHREALRIRPGNAAASFNLALALLMQGRWREGFATYSDRWQALGVVPRFPQPPWAGQPAEGKTLLIHDDQGLGDFIQFCRLVPLAAQRAQVMLQVPIPLRRILRSLSGAHGEYRPEDHSQVPAFDFQSPIMDLPHALGMSADTILPAPYLAADAELAAHWRKRLAGLPGLRVGLVWAGNPDYATDRGRSLPFAALAPLERLNGVSFVSLQKGGAARTQRQPGELAKLTLHDWTGELTDFADTAALIAGLDLVISVDTSVAHLAGAIGAPVWLLNRFDTDWRWLHQGTDTMWYPSMRIFRQLTPRDWGPVLAEVAAALEAERDAAAPAFSTRG